MYIPFSACGPYKTSGDPNVAYGEFFVSPFSTTHNQVNPTENVGFDIYSSFLFVLSILTHYLNWAKYCKIAKVNK